MATVTADDPSCADDFTDAPLEDSVIGVQFDLAGVLGIEPGRYYVRRPDDAPVLEALLDGVERDRRGDVLVVSTVGAPVLPDRRGFRRRPRRLTSLEGADEIWLNRVTYVRGDHIFANPRDVQNALGRLLGSREEQALMVSAAFAVTNLAIRAQRISDGDPSLNEVHPHQVWRTRIGSAGASQVAAGLLDEAFEFPLPPAPRWHDRLPSAEAVARALGGREQIRPCDELLVRVAGDAGAGRYRLAAAQLPAVVALAADDTSGQLTLRAASLAERAVRDDLTVQDHTELAELVRSLWSASTAARAAAGRNSDPEDRR
jgi:hypothetical protein